VRVYGETNFLLELAFDQGEARSCDQLLTLSQAGSLTFVIPAVSIFEARQSLARRHEERRSTHIKVDEELTLVLASVLGHLDSHPVDECCFLNRNWKDFADPAVVEKLKAKRCKLLASFDDGLQYVVHRLGPLPPRR